MNLSPNQLFMLRMFEKGWGFKMYNNKPGSWTTYWSLRRRGLLGPGPTVSRSDGNLIAMDRLTQAGRDALRKHKEKANEDYNCMHQNASRGALTLLHPQYRN